MEHWRFPSVRSHYIQLALCSGCPVSDIHTLIKKKVIKSRKPNFAYIAWMQNTEVGKTITLPDMYELHDFS